MANLSTILKSEITRLARKEIKGAVDPLRKANAGYRRDIAALKRQLSEMQRQVARQAKPAPAKAEQVGDGEAPRVTAKGIKSLRSKLGLSGADFGRLVGASLQSVYNWEAGKAKPRASQRIAIAAVKGLGKREAAQRLEAAR
jgi:DNA-binding transcriptional regulator YiaG